MLVRGGGVWVLEVQGLGVLGGSGVWGVWVRGSGWDSGIHDVRAC